MYTKRITSTRLIKSWRLGNGILLLGSLFLPWIISWSDIFLDSPLTYSNGFSLLVHPQNVVWARSFIEDFLPGKFLSFLGWSLLDAVVPIIAIGYSMYCVIAFFSNAPRGFRSGKWLSLRLIVLLLVAYPLWHVSYGIGFNTQLSWGYYVAIIGFISSALLELYSIFLVMDQQRNPSVQPECPEAG